MIEDRPAWLRSLPYYHGFPALPLQVQLDALHPLLRLDIFDLVGLLPTTKPVAQLYPDCIMVQPSEEELLYHEENGTKFVMVSVVVNVHTLKEKDGELSGIPYAVSLFPASKRGRVDYRHPRFPASFDLESMPNDDPIYVSFDPFRGDWGLYGKYTFFARHGTFRSCPTDSIGFVVGVYFLADRTEYSEIILSGPKNLPRHLFKRYWRWRVKKYFKPFTDVVPRRVWGADSPIELFLIQALTALGLQPQIQCLIYRDGSLYPCFHEIVYRQDLPAREQEITSADLFFPDQKCAIFCDSGRFHRKKRRENDARITDELEKLGIRVMRVSGMDIMTDLEGTAEDVAAFVQEAA